MAYEFDKALEMARLLWESDFELRCQHFSFAFYKRRILAVGRNQNKTHTLNLRNPIYFNGKIYQFKNVCSELSLFLTLRNRTNIPFQKITVVNVRLDRNFQVKMSCPCRSCQSLFQYLKPKNVFYTNDSGQFVSYY